MHRQVAIIGAGIAGLAAARNLHAAGVQLIVLDKGRGPGGRTSARRTPQGTFDHGAQYFTARAADFSSTVQAWQDAGVVAPWSPRLIDAQGAPIAAKARFLPQPAMNSLAKYLARDIDLCSSVEITRARRVTRLWTLTGAGGERYTADALIVAVPAPQVQPLLGALSAQLAAALGAVAFAPCWAVLASAADPTLDAGFDAAFIDDGPLSWASRLGAKPGRAPAGWLLHGSPEFSRAALDAAPEDICTALSRDFTARFGIALTPHAVAHRWRFARAVRPAGREPCLSEHDAALVLCGDWCTGERIEDAYLSGVAASEAVLARLEHPRQGPSP